MRPARIDPDLIGNLEPRLLLAGDHPSLADFPSATEVVLVDNPEIESSIGQASGVIGVVGDDDLFSFIAPYSARAAIVVAQHEVGDLAPAIRLHDSAGAPLSVLADGWDGVAAVPPVPIDLEEGVEYFVNVRAGTPSDTNESQVTGGYTLVIVMEIPPLGSQPAPGDNEPVLLPIDDVSGEGRRHGYISGFDETDQYYFSTIVDGEVVLTLTTPGSDLDAHVEVVDEFGATVAVGAGDPQALTVAFQATAFNRYVARVRPSDAAAPGAASGAYTISALAPVPGTPDEPPADQHLSNAEIARATPIPVDLLTGFARTTDAITAAGDSDVFVFRALQSGVATVVVEAASDASFHAALDVFRNQFTRVAFDQVGGQAWLARVTFEVVEGSDYYIRVRGRDASLGSYTLRASSPLSEYVVMYPEGYSTGTIDEYIPLVNPNTFPVSYTITARYEVGERDQIIASGVIPPSSRGGVTITSRRTPGHSLVRTDTPYALEIRSSGALGATLSHYDFGVTTGENFTSQRSTSWTFADAHRDPDRFRDFLVFYNPNPSAAVLRVSLVYDDGDVVSFTRELDAFRRGGVNFTTDTALTRDGNFSVRVDSDQPIVAALSSYDFVDQRGYGLLGDAGAGDTHGAIPLFSGSPGAAPTIAIYNASGVPADVVFTATILNPSPADTIRQFTVAPGRRLTLTAHDLGLDADALAALRYSANVPVTVSASEYHTGDGDSTPAASHAVASSLIADAFVNPQGAGTTYRELLSVYNPWSTSTQVQVSLLREGGILDTLTVNVPARGYSFIRVDQMPGILAQSHPVAFSVRIDGAAPVVAAFMHYDLFLDGGWATLASPLGLPTPLRGI